MHIYIYLHTCGITHLGNLLRVINHLLSGMILQVGADHPNSSSSWGNRKLQLRSESGPCDSFQMMATSTTTRLCFQNGGRLLGRFMTNEALAGFNDVEHVVDYFTMAGLISEGHMVNREWAIARNVVAVGLRYIWVSDLEPFRPADECFAAGPILGRRCQQAHGRVKCDLGRSRDTYVMKDQRNNTSSDMLWQDMIQAFGHVGRMSLVCGLQEHGAPTEEF